jgi:hypothetical protein
MSHTALVNGALLGLLAVMILLLVICLTAVVLAPAQPPRSGVARSGHGNVPPLPSRWPPASTPSPTSPRRQPPVTAPTAGLFAAPIADEQTTGPGVPLPLMNDRIPQPEVSGKPPWELTYDRIPRPEVSGRPPWEPAPKPPGRDG